MTKKIALSMTTSEIADMIFALKAKIKELYEKLPEPTCYREAYSFEQLLNGLIEVSKKESENIEKSTDLPIAGHSK